MNLPFQALLLFVLSLPGIAFRYAYVQAATRRAPIGGRSVAEEAVASLFFAALLHSAWVPLANLSPWTRVDLEAVTILLMGTPDIQHMQRGGVIPAVSGHAPEILFYFLTLVPLAVALGHVAARIVQRTNLDKRFWFLRAGDDWHYVLLGEYQELQHVSSLGRRADAVWGAAALEIAGAAYLYVGLLEDFYYDSTGRLDRIVLRQAHRRRLSDDRPQGQEGSWPDPRYYRIEGDYVVLPTSEILNLNIRYVFVDFE